MSRAASSGFTTSEIVIALVIVAILLLIAIPQFSRPNLTTVTAPDSVVSPEASGTIAVRVTSRGGAPQRGVSVTFEAQGKGSVTPAEVRTDSAGVATSIWRAAPDTGAVSITVRAAGRARPEIVLRTRVRGAASVPLARP